MFFFISYYVIIKFYTFTYYPKQSVLPVDFVITSLATAHMHEDYTTVTTHTCQLL